MGTVRLRVEFEDRHILSKSQRSERLKRSWLLLKPPQETISDLSSYLVEVFDLYHSCPNGVILSMDGFVLPPFESTCILKDKDVISIRRKGELLSEIVEVSDGANLIDEDEIVDKQPVLTDVPLLANKEFEEETGGYQSEPEEDEVNRSEDELHVENSPVVSKKRKASKKLQSSKKKRKCHKDLQDVKNDFHKEEEEGCELHPEDKKKKKKKKESGVKSEPKAESTPSTSGKNDDILEHSPSPKRSGQLQENGIGCNNTTQIPDGTIKVPSRSARRKKAKRQWLREKAKAEKNEVHEMQSPEKDEQENDTLVSSLQDEVQNKKSEADNEIVEDDKIVPIVIRPGHIRFEPLEEDQAVQQNQVYVETFQWNGITSKKKGQKWGKEKLPYRRNDYKESNHEHSEMITAEKVKPLNDPIDFDKLAPFIGSPKEGDVIAYRLLELSSTWTPELSPFRVGKTSWYDPESEKVLLTPVPEHPVIFKELDEDASSEQPDNSLYSLYREDGSLEIDFMSLVDVRIVKLGKSDSAKAVISSVNNGSMANGASTSTTVPVNNGKQTNASTSGKDDNAWDDCRKRR